MEEKITQPIEQAGMYTFYEEYDVGLGGFVSRGNCIAVKTQQLNLLTPIKIYPSYATMFEYPDGPVVYVDVRQDYLDQFCKGVTEDQARRIHPNLFRFLDQVNTS